MTHGRDLRCGRYQKSLGQAGQGVGYPSPHVSAHPLRDFRTSPEVIRLAAMSHVRFPLSLPNVQDLLPERGIEVGQETVRFWCAAL